MTSLHACRDGSSLRLSTTYSSALGSRSFSRKGEGSMASKSCRTSRTRTWIVSYAALVVTSSADGEPVLIVSPQWIASPGSVPVWYLVGQAFLPALQMADRNVCPAKLRILDPACSSGRSSWARTSDALATAYGEEHCELRLLNGPYGGYQRQFGGLLIHSHQLFVPNLSEMHIWHEVALWCGDH